MNKLILITTLLAIGTGCDRAGSQFSLGTNMPSTNALISADHEYEIDTWGANSEVYEFTPRSNPNISCTMLMLDNGKAMGLQCFEKAKPE